MQRSKILETDRDALTAFRKAFVGFVDSNEPSADRSEVDRVAGRAAQVLTKHGATVQYTPGGGAPFVRLNVAQVWDKVVWPDRIQLSRGDVLGVVDQATGSLDEAIGQARQQERSLAGRIARVIRFPAEVRDAAGLPAKSPAGLATVSVVGFIQAVIVGTITAVLAALVLRLF